MSTQLNEEVYDKLIAGDLSMKEFNRLKQDIDTRFIEIITYLYEKVGKKINWFDYKNAPQDPDDGPGFFDIEEYSKNIKYIVAFVKNDNDYWGEYSESIPTRWLKEDYKAEIDKGVKAWKEEILEEAKKESEKIQNTKNEKEKRVKNIPVVYELQKSILYKLTPEEKAVIQFKPFLEVESNLDSVLKQPSLPDSVKGKLDKGFLTDFNKEQNAGVKKKKKM